MAAILSKADFPDFHRSIRSSLPVYRDSALKGWMICTAEDAMEDSDDEYDWTFCEVEDDERPTFAEVVRRLGSTARERARPLCPKDASKDGEGEDTDTSSHEDDHELRGKMRASMASTCSTASEGGEMSEV
ncbi:unnamed protein product [Effrenium voratum]|uniref:Uncharacterized protein n=1 Tax=Effrenium voratum TaxID=2562239 RepID=A0AA36HNJ4_9DINO|nr:unnamed protein product [Effrenium voratum]